jgi:hypothetical protein
LFSTSDIHGSDLGLAQFNKAGHALSLLRIKANYSADGPSLLRFPLRTPPLQDPPPPPAAPAPPRSSLALALALALLDELMQESGDSWLVLYYNSSSDESRDYRGPTADSNLDVLLQQWEDLAETARETMNVAAVDLKDIAVPILEVEQQLQSDFAQTKEHPNCIIISDLSALYSVEVDTQHKFKPLPTVKLHRGQKLHPTPAAPGPESRPQPGKNGDTASPAAIAALFTTDIEGETYEGDLFNATQIWREVEQKTKNLALAPGSIASVPFALRGQYRTAQLNMR